MKMQNNKSKQLSSRAGDLGELLLAGSTGFAVRKRTVLGLFIHFFLLGCVVILGASLLVHFNSPEGCALAVGMGGVFLIISHNMEKLKKVKQSLEFMNALFSSALGRGHKFCCIVKNTGDVVFFNRAFQAVFPAYISQTDRKISALMQIYNVPDTQRDHISNLMSSNTEGTLTAVFREATATSELSMTISIEPIDRPTGFFLVRGK